MQKAARVRWERMQGPPQQIQPDSLANYLDVLTKAVFQSGISWRVVEAKWAGTREALFEFDPQRGRRPDAG